MKTNRFIAFQSLLVSGVLGFASAQAAIVVNPSFESNYNDSFPHYGAIDSWNGGSGVNQSDGPFHNTGTPIPDDRRVAFLQGSANMSQDLTGLQAGKRYWVQFYYDARACCGGSIDLATKINDAVLDTIPNVKPSTGGDPYRLHTVAFTADSDTATLTLSTIASGDATVNIDAVNVVQRDTGNLVIANPSFEASGDVVYTDADGNVLANDGLLIDPGTGDSLPLGGWAATGVYGVNTSGAGPYADNGAAPDQDHVAVLKGVSSISQTFKVVSGKPYQLSLAYNAKSGSTPHIQIKVGDAVLFEEDVTAVGGTTAYKTKSVTFTPSDVNATITIAQTKDGEEFLLVDDVKVTGEVPPDIDPTALAPEVAELGAGEQLDLTVSVSSQILATKDITIGLATSAAGVARFVDASSGGLLPRVNVTFTKGGANTKTVKIQGIARGTANIQIFDPAGLPIKNQVTVTVVQDPVKNPSFETTPAPGGVGYGAIAGWNGGSGINTSAGPFADNGVIPDRLQVGFQQGAGTLSQTLNGLIPGKNYWLQIFYNVRNGSTMDVSINVGGKEVSKLTAVTPAGDGVPYNFVNIPFVAESSNPLLEIKTTPTGDSTLLVDGINIVRRDPGQIVVRNPSFEASGSVYLFPGYFAAVAGWDHSGGGFGVNIDGAGPFTDNGRANAGDLVLFLQGAGTSVSQNLTGLTAGEKYIVGFLVNARNCCVAEDSSYTVSLNDAPLLDEPFTPVGGANPFGVKQVEFTADSTEGVLKFAGTAAGDHTLLLDNVVVQPSSAAPFILSQPATATGTVGESTTLHVAAVGGGTLTYQWKKGGQAIAGQTSDTLTLDNVTADAAGDYTVDVKNAGGTVTSDVAHLSVLVAVPGVYDTGVSNDRVLLDDGATDPHYTLVTNADDSTSNIAYVADSTKFPIVAGPWVANSDVSKWIGPLFDPSGNTGGGDYVYRMNLDLTGFDPASVILSGGIASDNSVSILVNGVDTGITQSGFGGLENRTINGVFKPGFNQVDFKVNNGGAGPTGLRIEGLTAIGVSTGVVTDGPKLTITKSGQTARVSWPSSATGVTLQTASDIKGPWAASALPVQSAGNESFVVDNIGATGARFYTLKK